MRDRVAIAPPDDAPAVLVVLPSEGGRDQVDPHLSLIGLPLLRRIALAGARAGFGRVLVAGAPAEPALLAGTGATALTAADSVPDSPGRVVLLSARAIPQVDWLRRLRTMPLPPGHLHLDAGVAGALDAAEPARLASEAGRLGGVDAALEALAARYKVVDGPEAADGRFVLDGPGDVDRAEQWMLRSLIKDSEGFMSRHFERRLSLWATRRLARTRVTPNAVTVVSLAIGMLAAPLFSSSRPAWQVAGALLFLTHSILDGCDGELARLKFRQSRLGAVLDFWGDNVVHVLVFAGMAVGWSRAADSAWPLWAGGVAISATLAAAAWLQRWQVERPASEGDGAPRAATRLVDLFAHRDFIYLILALACWGRAWWFLGLAAAGIPVFLLALVATGGLRRGAPGG